MSTFIALLRGFNVGSTNRIPMAALRSACEELGWAGVRTYIQTGNIVFEAKGARTVVERELERRIERRFGLTIPVIARTATEWSAYLPGNPFPEASREEPSLVMLAVSKAPPRPEAVRELEARAARGERIVRVGDALWIHFGAGVAGSKLSPGLLDRAVGSPVTTRNWRTVLKLDQLARLPA
ncbi:MAG TPA: DUF1697 domain-containing protein [Gemmatimonadales bacterium]|nr:DUF1697 domain-containing protein [Gemmatimonadales bacterium]